MFRSSVEVSVTLFSKVWARLKISSQWYGCLVASGINEATIGQNAITKPVVETWARLVKISYQRIRNFTSFLYLGLKVHLLTMCLATLFLIRGRGSSKRSSRNNVLLARYEAKWLHSSGLWIQPSRIASNDLQVRCTEFCDDWIPFASCNNCRSRWRRISLRYGAMEAGGMGSTYD